VESHPDLPLCREASNYSSLHPSGRFSSPSGRPSVFNQASGFLCKTQIWEDCCADDVDSHRDVLIHKASIVIQIQTSRRQSVQTCEHHIWKLCASDQPFRRPSSRFGHAKPLYRNYCSERLTVRTRLSNREDLQRNFWNFGRTFVCPDGL